MLGRLAALAVLLPAVAHPQSPLLRTLRIEGHTITVDNTNARFRITVLDEFEDSPEEAQLARGLFRSFLAAYEAAKQTGATVLPSVSLVMNKGKAFNDGLYAAIELALEGPQTAPGAIGQVPSLMGKVGFLQELARRLAEAPVTTRFGEQAARIATSRVVQALTEAGQWAGPLPARYNEEDAGKLARKPVSFYTWTDQLRAIYKRDTALQDRYNLKIPEEVAAAALIVREILRHPQSTDKGPGLKEPYDRLNRLYATLTNPLTGPSAEEVLEAAGDETGLRAAINDPDAAAALGARLKATDDRGFAVFQPSSAKENKVLLQEGMEGFIRAIRSGEISLKPTASSGWYDYQQYALEPLLIPDKMPEGRKLDLDENYRKLLESAFKSIAAQVRETHAKQLEVAAGAEPPSSLRVTITPHFAVEPLATCYSRLAAAYQFLRPRLPDCLPTYHSLRALREGGSPREERADTDLVNLAALYRGMVLLCARDLGLPGLAEARDLQAGPGPLMDRAEQWLASWQTDPDMARDVRMMIEVARLPNRYWAVVGVRLTRIVVSFEQTPKVIGEGVTPEFESATYWVPTEQFVEVTGLDEPLDREEFRALCDRAQTQEKIVEELRRVGAKAGAVERLPDAGQHTPPADGAGPADQPGDLARHLLPGGLGPAAAGVVVLIIIAFVVARIVRGALGRP